MCCDAADCTQRCGCCRDKKNTAAVRGELEGRIQYCAEAGGVVQCEKLDGCGTNASLVVSRCKKVWVGASNEEELIYLEESPGCHRVRFVQRPSHSNFKDLAKKVRVLGS